MPEWESIPEALTDIMTKIILTERNPQRAIHSIYVWTHSAGFNNYCGLSGMFIFYTNHKQG